MDKKIIFITNILLFIIVGIAPAKGVAMENVKKYEQVIRDKAKKITFKDGINKEEAILLAQKELLDSKYKDKYLIMEPIVNYDKAVNTWGIQFKIRKGYSEEDY